MIEIPLTQAQFDEKAKMLKVKHGVELQGNAGTISKMGVTAQYVYRDGILGVSIVEKPFFVSTEYCEEQLRGFLAA